MKKWIIVFVVLISVALYEVHNVRELKNIVDSVYLIFDGELESYEIEMLQDAEAQIKRLTSKLIFTNKRPYINAEYEFKDILSSMIMNKELSDKIRERMDKKTRDSINQKFIDDYSNEIKIKTHEFKKKLTYIRKTM